jgi:hypothetical protein
MAERKLENLIVDEETLNEELIYDVLSKFIRITKTSKTIIPTGDFSKLSEKNKIIVFLLARKAMKALNILESEMAGPKEISKETGVSYNSVKPYLSALYKEKILAKQGTEYLLPNYNLVKVKEILSTGE